MTEKNEWQFATRIWQVIWNHPLMFRKIKDMLNKENSTEFQPYNNNNNPLTKPTSA